RQSRRIPVASFVAARPEDAAEGWLRGVGMDSPGAKSERVARGGADQFDRNSGCEPGLSNRGKFIFSEAGGFRAVRGCDTRGRRLLAVDGPSARDSAATAPLRLISD